jgi:hypothetical protein
MSTPTAADVEALRGAWCAANTADNKAQRTAKRTGKTELAAYEAYDTARRAFEGSTT